MKAVFINEHGGPEKLIYGDMPDPVIGSKEVLMQVKASGVNRGDIVMRKGQQKSKRTAQGITPMEPPLPFILGADLAGVVTEVGVEVQNFKAGDRVLVNPVITCGQCEFCLHGDHGLCRQRHMLGVHTNGGYAEYAKAPEENIHLIPGHLSFDEAAAIPSAFLTAWHALITRAQLRAGEVVLLHATGSGVGSAAIQVAKGMGAQVIVTDGTEEKLEEARRLGADECINYPLENFNERELSITGADSVDVILDLVGPPAFERYLASLKPGGRMVCASFTSDPVARFEVLRIMRWGLSILGQGPIGNKKEVLKVMEFVHRGKFRGVVEQAFDLKDAANAHRIMESRELFGKLILHP